MRVVLDGRPPLSAYPVPVFGGGAAWFLVAARCFNPFAPAGR